MKTCLSTMALMMIAGAVSAATSPDWAIHEWGTFTSLQDEHGAAIGGINTDDEAVPKFVHRLADLLLITPTEAPPSFFPKGAPRCHPDVTMRMETPVIYFHPPAGTEAGAKVDVQVTFNGGWLSEFYPQAEITVPGLESNRFNFGPLLSSTVSTLSWLNLEVGGDYAGPKTDSRVWTSPRHAQSAPVRTANGEEEQFLFYRGVAHIDAPLKISSDGGELTFRSQLEGGLASGAPLPIKSLWLVDIHPDGKIAYRALPALTLDGDQSTVLEKVRSDFKPSDQRLKNFDILKSTLRQTLVANGLFADEAQALLDTWEISYFKSAGLRVFFIVPRAWTDYYLPLKVSVPAQINRVMVGRIELVTPEQKENLRAIAALSPEQIKADSGELSMSFVNALPRSDRTDNKQKMLNLQQLGYGAISLKSAGIAVPKGFQYYLDLGRFRNALVLNELANHPTEGLKAFVATYNLGGYKPVQVSQN